MKSIRERVLAVLARTSGVLSAYDLAKLTGANPASVSGVVCKMTAAGQIKRLPMKGERGGYGYAALFRGIR